MATSNVSECDSSDEVQSFNDSDNDNDVIVPAQTTSFCLTQNKINMFCEFELNKPSANIMHLNCRSLKMNFDSLKVMLSTLKENFTAIALSETWLTKSTEDMYKLNGYDFICKSRLHKVGGGVGIFINNYLTYKIRDDLTFMNDVLECVFVEIVQEKSNFLIGCIYRPPGGDISIFNDFLVLLLDKINLKRRPLLTFLTGDFNIDLLKTDNSHTRQFLNLMSSYSFLPTINCPTRITEFSATLIDNIFINDLTHKFGSAAISSDISDHLPVLIHLQLDI